MGSVVPGLEVPAAALWVAMMPAALVAAAVAMVAAVSVSRAPAVFVLVDVVPVRSCWFIESGFILRWGVIHACAK